MGKRVTNKHFRDPTAEAVFGKEVCRRETKNKRNRYTNNKKIVVKEEELTEMIFFPFFATRRGKE